MGPARTSRRDVMLKLLGETDRLDVAELTRRFGVSEMTIRRDLAKLQEDGLVRRVHGGAVRLERSTFETRTVRFSEEKQRIGDRAAEFVRDGESVAIDTGTTAHYVARALRDRSDLVVVTNSINVAAEFRHSANKVVLVGGVLVPELCLVGSLATDTLRRLHVNKLILGCGGLTPERGLAYFDIDEAEVRRAMIDIADEVIVVMDDSKFGRTETVSMAQLSDVDAIVTNAKPPGAYQKLLADNGVELVIA